MERTRQNFERVWGEEKAIAWAVCRRMLGPDCEDAVQETALKLWKHWHTVPFARVGAWITVVARREALMSLRGGRKHARGRTEIVDLPESESVFLEIELKRRIAEWAASPEFLGYRLGFSAREIGKRLGKSKDRVKKIIYRHQNERRSIKPSDFF